MFEWPLEAARQADRVGAVVVAAPPGFEAEFEAAVESGDDGSPVQVVTGGAVRSESVLRGLAAVETDFVVVHDAARAMVEASLFDEVLGHLIADPDLDGVIAATPVTDTIKRASPIATAAGLARVSETLNRSELWSVQTPQAFRTDVLRRALTEAESLADATDDAMLVEAVGGSVALLPAPSGNFKITTGDDLARADAILARRQMPDPST